MDRACGSNTGKDNSSKFHEGDLLQPKIHLIYSAAVSERQSSQPGAYHKTISTTRFFSLKPTLNDRDSLIAMRANKS